jgi:glyceraldehyde 3-phosphate dehydrogenase
MKRLKVGLNGFGRIGRAFTRLALDRDVFDLAVINTRKTANDNMAYLLQYDSVYRKYHKTVAAETDCLTVDGKKIPTTLSATPEEAPWDKYDVDVVVDATGAFNTTEDLKKHIKGSVKKVVLTAPSKDDETPHVVLGVNDSTFDFASCDVISNCSCTTNSASPMFKILYDNFKVVSGMLTTIHAVTLTQSMLDDTGKSFDRSRAAMLNIVPSTSGAAKAVVKTIPELKGKLEVGSIRVPVPTGSLSDVSVVVEKATTVEEVNNLFKQAAEGPMKGILEYQTETLVSSDYIGNPHSCIFDSNYSKVINGTMVKVMGWYDNEWGYSNRLVDLIEKLSSYFS